MLKLIVPAVELYDEDREIFVTSDEVVLRLEHSLVSLSKWESEWGLPFLSDKSKTTEQTLSYIRCMTEDEIPDEVLTRLTKGNLEALSSYINDSKTATWFSDDKQKRPGAPNSEQITSELIYYWMAALTLPIEMEHWHLTRLVTMIRVANLKNQPAKKMSKADLMARNRELNRERQGQNA